MVVKPENVVQTVVATDVAVIQITAVKKDKPQDTDDNALGRSEIFSSVVV